MDGEVGFDGSRVGLQMVDPRVVTLLLRRHRGLLLAVHRAHESLLDPGQPRFDSAQAAGDAVILLGHLWRG